MRTSSGRRFGFIITTRTTRRTATKTSTGNALKHYISAKYTGDGHGEHGHLRARLIQM